MCHVIEVSCYQVSYYEGEIVNYCESPSIKTLCVGFCNLQAYVK